MIIPKVYIVATPIGNLADLSERAKRVLAEVDLIAAEDTRHTAQLLRLLQIPPKTLVSYHDHIEEKRAQELIDKIKSEGLQLAVVSDAGTPCIADPGFRIVAKARAEGLQVIPIPGPSALTSLACSAGLPTNRMLFIGFLPSKKQQLLKEFSGWAQLGASVLCFEAARRLLKTLALLREVLPEARVAIGRELTKMHEEIRLFSIEEALAWAAAHPTLKGEVSLMVSAGEPKAQLLADQMADRKAEILARAQQEVQAGKTHRDLMQHFAGCGLEKKELYALLLPLFH